MKKDKLKITALLIAILLVSMVFMTACFNADDDDDYSEIEVEEVTTIMTLEFASDSDNGVEFELEQDDELFDWEESIMVNGAYEGDEGGEVQTFDMFPIQAGTTTIRFTCEENDTVYTYECEIGDNLDTIKILKAEGSSGGLAVEPPAPVFESH